MSLLTALNPGLTGILSQQKQVEIAGNNIANVNTEGYSRQVADLTPKAAINIQGLFIGQGVCVEDVSREYDEFVTGQLMNQNNVLGEESAKSGPLAELERIFGIGDDSLASDIEDFFGAWHDLSQNPSGAVEREQVVYKGENLLESFDQTQSDLVVVRQNINETLQAEVGGINLKLQELAQLNADIKQKESLGHVANTDQDRRDLLVKELSGTLGIQTFDTGDSQIGVQLPGGIPLVQGDQAVAFQSYYDGDSLKFQIQSGDIMLPADVRNFGGEFKGLLELRDEFIPELEESVKGLQYDIVTQVNARHEAGFGLDGRTGRSFFTKPTSYQSQTGFADPRDLEFNTGTLEINGIPVDIKEGQNSLNGIRDAINRSSTDTGVLASVVQDGSGAYHLDLTPKTEGYGVTMFDTTNLTGDGDYAFSGLELAAGFDDPHVAIENIRAVAAAGATEGSPGDNENALSIYSLLNEPVAGGDKTFVDGYSRIASRVGTETRRNTMAGQGASDTMNQLENQRESIVGVSIEEEMMNLIQFQKGFEASSQYVRTIDEMLGTIIGMRR